MREEQDPDLFEPQSTAGVVRAMSSATFRFRCTGCGQCCRGPGSVYFTADDLAAIYEHLDLSAAERRSLRQRLIQGKENGYYYHRTGGACHFLDSEERCRIYEVRPLQCRSFPFWPSSFADQESYTEMRAECPGVDANEPETFSALGVARRVNETQRSFLAPQKVQRRRFMI
ncbi:MAG: YkgJ family cysteine cluster protein [Leptospirales bacterium]|nr:YkgJ family cysteine cluster protein [Leptospirales bacterium]